MLFRSAPQPGVAELSALADRVRATGLIVEVIVEGAAFPLGAAAELTLYRIVQEALTNTLRHAGARHAKVAICYAKPRVQVRVTDDGAARRDDGASRPDDVASPGHGLDGMRERVALHGGVLRAGPGPASADGWLVEASFRVEQVPA